jgi:hypothetical protein
VATMVDADDPSPAPSGTPEEMETDTEVPVENSAPTSSTTRRTGARPGDLGPNLSDFTVSDGDPVTVTLTLRGRAAARAQAPCTTKCSPAMMTFEGASATAFMLYESEGAVAHDLKVVS